MKTPWTLLALRALRALSLVLIPGCAANDGTGPGAPAPVAQPGSHETGHQNIPPRPAPPAPGVDLGARGRTISFSHDVVPILRQNCASCHSPGNRANFSVSMFDGSGQPTYGQINSALPDMIQAIQSGSMPPSRLITSVSREQLAILQAWASEGAPDN